MRILHLTYSFNNGGKENLIVDIANQQAQDGHCVHIFVINARYDPNVVARLDKTFAFRVIGRNKNPLWFILFFTSFFKLRPHVVHCHDQSLIKWLRFISPFRLCVTVHGTELDVTALKKYWRVFAISTTVQEEILHAGISSPILIENGVCSAAIKSKSEWKPGLVCRLVQVGNLLHAYKGQDISIRAVQKLIRQKQLKVTLDLIGDGDSYGMLKELADNLGIGHAVGFLGSRSRSWIYENIHAYDIMLQPGRNEGFGLTVVEGLLAGVPVIATDEQGPKEILANGKFGFLIEKENDSQLADVIESLIKTNNTDLLQKKINSARDHCKEHFDVKRTAREYVSHYN